MDSDRRAAWLALHLLPGLGAVQAARALERYQDPGAIAYRLPPEALPGIGAEGAARLVEGRRGLAARVEAELRGCERHRIRVLVRDEPDYPAALDEIPAAPLVLYVRGELPGGRTRLAVVGSRSPTVYGRRVAAGLAAGLAAREVEVVSGGARGIDRLAHEAALEERGTTVAVLGSGLLRPYPAEHAELFERIAAKGALVSEFPLEEPPRAENFPRRNRIISGLAAAVIVVEAAERSGTLSTAAHALDQGREVLAVPGPVDSFKSVGCHRLIQQGAKLVQNVEDILEELSPIYRLALARDTRASCAREAPQLDGLTADERDVLGMLAPSGPVQLDDLADRSTIGVARIQAALFGLELRGAVDQHPGGYYLLRPKKEP